MAVLTLKKCKELRRLVDSIYREAGRLGMSFPSLAKAAGLSHSTVYRLAEFETMYPRLQTVDLLARAVGFSLSVGLKRRLRLAG